MVKNFIKSSGQRTQNRCHQLLYEGDTEEEMEASMDANGAHGCQSFLTN